ncbi:MAG: rhomboid family intramembrane serine protease, partial [Gammaproteobacteria bacterium]
FTRRGHVALAEQQLEAYRVENLPVNVKIPPIIIFDSGWTGVIGYLLVIWALPMLQAWNAFGVAWRSAGWLEAGRVMEGEWWRTITALTLHADLAHIVGNSVFGAVFGVMVGRYLGSGLCWLLILVAAALANALNSSVQPEYFRAVGASTATFAALGLFAAFVWRRGYFRGRGIRRSLAPIFAGVALLAFTGMGGINTDILGHIAGFCAGLLFGILLAPFDIRRLGYSGQFLAGGTAISLVIVAWTFAARA